MFTKRKTIVLALVLGFSIASTLFPLSVSESATNKSLAFLSNVVGLDLSSYNVVLNGTSSYPTSFGADIKSENALYTLVSDQSTISAYLEYVNGSLWYFSLSNIVGTPIYSQPPSTSVLEQSKNLIQRYQTYAAQNYKSDISYISSMAIMLNKVNELKSTTITSGNMRLKITVTADTSRQRIKWFYTENGVNATRKSLTFSFKNGTLSEIDDSWNLYTIGSFNSISQEEVLSLAWDAAQNLTLKSASDNGSMIEVKPDLSHIISDVSFRMAPRYSSLYPFWNINYYFNKAYNSDYGIQVGIWGDTKQIAYSQPLTTLDGGEAPIGSIVSSQPIQSNANPPPNILALGAVVGIIVTVAAVSLAIKRRRK